MKKHFAIFSFALLAVLYSCGQANTNTTATEKEKKHVDGLSYEANEVYNGTPVKRSEEEWKKILTAEEYYVCREEGTERAFTGKYADHHEKGVYYCVACGLPLFSSETKFESGTGWPSYYQPINAKNVKENADNALGMVRTEVECARCGSHLGHIFQDAYDQPTGLRYCINSVSLHFEK